jgi:hypothetical protein
MTHLLLGLMILLCCSFTVAQAGEPGKITRALFTTGILDGQPVNRVLVLDDTVEKVHFFTELQNFQGQKITHRWEHNGQVVARKTFQIESARQTVSSAISIGRTQTGRWSVVIENQRGWPLRVEIFMYGGEALASHGVVILPLK